MNTIKQKTLILNLGDEQTDRKVRAHRMRWKAARDFFRLLSGHLGAIAADFQDGEIKKEAILRKLPELIGNTEDLVGHLLEHSIDLSLQEIDELDLAQVGACVAAALELNLDDEVKNSLAGITARLAGLVGKLPTTNAGASATPTS